MRAEPVSLGPRFQTRAIVPLWDMWPRQETFWVVSAEGGTREPVNVPVHGPGPSVWGAEAEKAGGGSLPVTGAFLHTPPWELTLSSHLR